jgi:hypothetical protein
MSKGKILRVKEGYNPNSSSVGSAIPVYLLACMSVGAASVILANIASRVSKKIKEEKQRKDLEDVKG